MPTNKKKFATHLVTGCAGFIGFHLTKKLLESGHSVIGIDNLDPFYDTDQKLTNVSDLKLISAEKENKFEFRNQDINFLKRKDFADPLPETIFHLAAKAGVIPSIADPLAYELSNVRGTLTLLELARELKIRNFIFASSSSVYGKKSVPPFTESESCGEPISPYAASKRSSELYCQTYSHLHQIKIAVLRFFTVYGPRQRPDLAIHLFLNKMLKQETITLYDQENMGRDYTYVEDIVDGILKAQKWITQSNEPICEYFNLGTGRSISPSILIDTLEKVSRVRAQIHRSKKPPGDMAITLANLEKSRRVLNFDPRTSFEDGIRNFYEWFLTRHQEKKAA